MHAPVDTLTEANTGGNPRCPDGIIVCLSPRASPARAPAAGFSRSAAGSTVAGAADKDRDNEGEGDGGDEQE